MLAAISIEPKSISAKLSIVSSSSDLGSLEISGEFLTSLLLSDATSEVLTSLLLSDTISEVLTSTSFSASSTGVVTSSGLLL